LGIKEKITKRIREEEAGKSADKNRL